MPSFRLRFAPSLFVFALLAIVAGCGDRSDILPFGLDASVADGPERTDRHEPDGTPPGECGPATCPTGCCTASGECVQGTASDDCGANGGACITCPASETCNPLGACQSQTGCSGGPVGCSGCCDSQGNCRPGNSVDDCGLGGVVCAACESTGTPTCEDGTCGGIMTECSPASCPGGCCTGSGQCMFSSTATCGIGGVVCTDCSASGEACNPAGDCVSTSTTCSPENCPGCCLDGQCVTGGDQGACGADGQACIFCPPGSFCNDDVCQPMGDEAGGCGPDNCAGCCGLDGTCRGGTRTRACGTGGEMCVDCGPGGACQNGFCDVMTTCGPGNCGGCCDGTGTCQAGDSTAACGGGGGTCSACPPGDTCTGGACKTTTTTCGPTTCKGCCDAGGNCQAGDSLNACGVAGAACASCPAGDACVGSVCAGSTCTENCPSGCCDENDVCQPGTTTAACGEGGACAVCSPGSTCEEGQCFGSTCSAATCPTGCCDGNGACQPGNQPFECGTGGVSCNSCGPTQQCNGGSCQNTACNEETCPGCCDQNDQCQAGTSNAACGEGGDPCNACPATGGCTEGECVGFTCGPTTCPDGCCDSSGNCQTGAGLTGGQTCPCAAFCEGCCDAMGDCRAGTIDDACGSGGASCADCTSMNETCDDDMFPVVCDQSCPAPFAGCPAGTTEPAPVALPGACHVGDLEDAAAGCMDGASTADCENFFDGEFESNGNCANCLEQFDVDFVDLTGIYLCAEPFVSTGCEGNLGCATDCISTVCEACGGDPTECENSAITGECSMLVDLGNKCVAGTPAAQALCGQSNYANFGAWLQAVGNHYCAQ